MGPLPRRLLLTAAAALVAAVLTLAGTAMPALAAGEITVRWASLTGKPNADGAFEKANRRAARVLKRSGRMELLAGKVSARFELPNDIPVFFSDALEEDIGPAYGTDETIGDYTGDFIVYPGRDLTADRRDVRKALRGTRRARIDHAFVGATEFMLAHEIGHALVDQLDIPITGKEEDAVDAFAFYLLHDDPNSGPVASIGAAVVFDVLARRRGHVTDRDLADEHSTYEQRVYQFLCWTYGSDPRRFRGLLGPDGLPRQRARRCARETSRMLRSWDRLLQPHRKPVA